MFVNLRGKWTLPTRFIFILVTLVLIFFGILVASIFSSNPPPLDFLLGIGGLILLFGGLTVQAFPYRRSGKTYAEICSATVGRVSSMISPIGVIVLGTAGILMGIRKDTSLFWGIILTAIGVTLLGGQIYFRYSKREDNATIR